MYYSGIVVTCRKEALGAVAALVSEVPGAEIHQTDAETGRLVVVIEAESINEETKIFQKIRMLSGVLDTSLIVHREDGET